MPMQQQNSSFAASLGGGLARANEECKGKPLDLGQRRLPPGIRNAVAKLQHMYTKISESDNGQTPKGKPFFRASASVVTKEWNGEKIEGMITQCIIPLCATVIKRDTGEEVVPFTTHFNRFRSLFESLGIKQPTGPQYDVKEGMTDEQVNAQSKNIEAYYFSAMKALTDPKNPPVFIEFSTRGYKSKKKPGESQEAYDRREPMVIEEWHGRANPESVANINAAHSPAAGFREAPPATNGPPVRYTPEPEADGGAFNEMEETPTSETLEEEVERLVNIAVEEGSDGPTEEAKDAQVRLEELAKRAGWTEEQIVDPPPPFTNDWQGVGEMVLSPPSDEPHEDEDNGPPLGSEWLFTKRDTKGNKMKDRSKKDLPPIKVKVKSVDTGNQTCIVATEDGKPIIDMRSREPVSVKWEWLEPLK